jgi:DNA recombination-dependent growth factor C
MLSKFQGKKINLSSKRTESISWVMPKCSATEELDENSTWDMSHCLTDDGFLLRMRIEKKAVPPELLRLMLMNKTQILAKQRSKPISRAEKKEIKEEVSLELLERALPSILYIDALWEESTGRLLLFSTGKRIKELFEDLFRKTFADSIEADLVRVDPPFLGMSQNAWSNPEHAEAVLSKISSAVPVTISAKL